VYALRLSLSRPLVLTARAAPHVSRQLALYTIILERMYQAASTGVCSPVLSNVYLDKLDQYVETVLLPAYNRGEARRTNPAYTALERPIARAKRVGTPRETAALRQQMRQLPSQDPHDPQYRRLRYVRYADDWLLGFAGPKAEAEEIKRHLRVFLRDTLKLELSEL